MLSGVLSPRWRKILRDVWLHKSRTVLVVLAIAIGLTGAGAVLDTWSLVRQVTGDDYRASNPASATLRTDAIDRALLARVKAMPGVAEAQARRVVMGSAQVAGGRRAAMLFAMEDFTAIRIGVVKPETGVWPPPDLAIVVERSSMDLAGILAGATLTVQVGNGEALALPVAGTARDVGLPPGWMDHVVYGFVTRATLARLGAPSSLGELQIVAAAGGSDRGAVRRLAARVKTTMEAAGHRVTSVDVPVPGRHPHAAQMDSLLFMQGAFGALALLLSGLLVVSLVAAMLAGQVREIGVMKAIGASGGQIAALYLGLAFVLGLTACAVGLPAAAVIGRAYARFTADLLNFDIAGRSIPLHVFLVQLAVGALLPVAAAAIPVARGCRISAGEALRDYGIPPPRGGAGGGWLLRHTSGLRRPLLLSLRNAFRNRQRMALTLITLATGGAVYLGAQNLRASILGAVDLLFSSQRYDLGLRMARPYPAGALEAAVASVAGVARVEAWSSAQAAVSRPDGTPGSKFPITAPPLSSRLLVFAMERGRWPRAGDRNALVVNRRLLEDEPDLEVGAEVTLLVEGRPARFKVVGVVDSGPATGAYALRDALSAINGGGAGGANMAVVAASLAGPAFQLDLVRRLRAELAGKGFEVLSGALTAQQRQVVEAHLLMVGGFLGVMGQLMIVVGGLGLGSTMSIAVLERRREIGVLRAIGARHRAILTLVQVEGLVIAAASGILALPLSVPMSIVLGQAFGRIMLRLPLTLLPQPGGVLRWLAVLVVVSLAACSWPAWRAMRVTTAAALAY